MADQRIPLADRFWSKVKKTDTCWLWQAQLNNKGYGRFFFYSKVGGRTSCGEYAHRVSWLMTHGDIPDGLRVLHVCDVPNCVRPDHLFLGTQEDNMRDCSRKGRVCFTCPTAKVSPDDVRAIRADPRKHHIIGADYGLKRGAVLNIKHRKTWADID